MSLGLLIVAGILLELGLGTYVVVLTLRENKAFKALVDQAAAEFVTAVDDLPQPYRSVARPLADQLAMDQDFDDALLDAVIDTTRQPFKKPLWQRLLVGVICSLAMLGPASYGLLVTASQIVTAWNESEALNRSVVYLRGQTELEGPFLLLRQAFHGSALLFFGLAFLWALAWYLRRPEVREARFIRTLLEAGARASPRSPAPASGRLSELIAPDRGLGRPITALVVCLCGITAGWLVLYETADVRAANDREPVFDVWPAKRARMLQTTAELSLPRSRAGAPLGDQPPPSLVIGPDNAFLGGSDLLVGFADGRLPENWKAEVPDVTKILATSGGRVVVSAHRELPLELVLQLMQYLQAKYDVDRFDLIVERTLLNGEPGGKPLQAMIPLELDSDRTAALRIEILDGGIRVPPETEVRPFEESDWAEHLRGLVRDQPALLRSKDRQAIDVRVLGRDLGYGRFVEVLAGADTACMGRGDCGLPGLGLVFSLRSGPNP